MADHGQAEAAPAAQHLRVIDAALDADALSLVRTERLRAKSEGRVLVVYVGASWCEPCQRFKAEIHAGRLDEKLGRVSLLAFDADKDADRLAVGGYGFRFIPYVALPGADGRPRESASAQGKGPEAWREIVVRLAEWQTGAP
jgi:thiol-disulfide isomerase/thioredoxin